MWATASGRDIGHVRLAATRTLARFAPRTAKRDEAAPAGAGRGVQPCRLSLSHDH